MFTRSLTVAFAMVLLFVVVDASKTRWHDLERVGYGFQHFKAEYGRTYSSASEEKKREDIFNKNLATILSHNRLDKSWKLGVNHMADRTVEELQALNGYRRPHPHHFTRTNLVHQPKQKVHQLPQSVDWRQKGALTPVKDQGHCGSCWAFATSQVVESFWFLKTGKIMDLSPQQIASCTYIPPACYVQGTGGCEGSSQVVAMDALIKNGGITTEYVYPYVTHDGVDVACRFPNNKTVDPIVQLTNYTVIESNSYDALMDALANNGPVTVSVDASTWHLYESGVYNGCNQTNPDIDHAVQAVGYGTDNGQDYWIVRNSWTVNWGENGYIRIARSAQPTCGQDPGAKDCLDGPTGLTVCGTCGILYDNAYPNIAN